MHNIRRVVASAGLVLSSLSAQAGEIKILIRYDDYSKFSNTRLEGKLLSAVESVGGGVVVGVIPFPYAPHPAPGGAPPKAIDLDNAKIQLLNDYVSKGTAAIAVHGYSHINTATSGPSSELAPLPEADQHRLLAAAKGAVERSFGREVSLFVPPFNNFNSSTQRALKDSGYKLLSSGALAAGQTSGRLLYLPGSVYAQQLKGVVLDAVAKNHSDGIVVAVLHSYDFAGFGEPFPAFRKTSAQISVAAFIDDLQSLKAVAGVRLVSLAELEQSGEDMSAQRLQANVSLLDGFLTRHQLLPVFLGLQPSMGVYYTQDAARTIQTRQVWACVFLYASLFIAAGIATTYLLRLLIRAVPQAAVALLALACVGIVMMTLKFALGTFYMNAGLALTCCAGMLAGALRFQCRLRLDARLALLRPGSEGDPRMPRRLRTGDADR